MACATLNRHTSLFRSLRVRLQSINTICEWLHAFSIQQQHRHTMSSLTVVKAQPQPTWRGDAHGLKVSCCMSICVLGPCRQRICSVGGTLAGCLPADGTKEGCSYQKVILFTNYYTNVASLTPTSLRLLLIYSAL